MEKVKVFSFTDSLKLEEAVNNFLSSDNIDIIRVLQTACDHQVTITIFYTIIPKKYEPRR